MTNEEKLNHVNKTLEEINANKKVSKDNIKNAYLYFHDLNMSNYLSEFYNIITIKQMGKLLSKALSSK